MKQQRSVRFSSSADEGHPVPASELQAVVNPMSAEHHDAGEWKQERQRVTSREAAAPAAAAAASAATAAASADDGSDEQNPPGFEKYMQLEPLCFDALLMDTGASGDDDDEEDGGGGGANGDDYGGLDDGTASRASTHQTQMDDTRRQLEDLQIRTIFSLVEPVQVDGQDKKHRKPNRPMRLPPALPPPTRPTAPIAHPPPPSSLLHLTTVLFLSNRQATKFDFSAMPKVRSRPAILLSSLPTAVTTCA